MTTEKNIALMEAFARYASRAIDLEAPADVQVALDAAQSGNAKAHELLVGMPVTWSIGSDRYTAKIARVTPSLLTIECEGERTFRFTGRYFTSGKHRAITLIGVAEPYSDPSF